MLQWKSECQDFCTNFWWNTLCITLRFMKSCHITLWKSPIFTLIVAGRSSTANLTFTIPISAVTQLAHWSICQLIDVKLSAVSNRDTWAPSAAITTPTEAHHPRNDTSIHIGMSSLEPAWGECTTALDWDTFVWHSVSCQTSESVPVSSKPSVTCRPGSLVWVIQITLWSVPLVECFVHFAFYKR